MANKLLQNECFYRVQNKVDVLTSKRGCTSFKIIFALFTFKFSNVTNLFSFLCISNNERVSLSTFQVPAHHLHEFTIVKFAISIKIRFPQELFGFFYCELCSVLSHNLEVYIYKSQNVDLHIIRKEILEIRTLSSFFSILENVANKMFHVIKKIMHKNLHLK